MEQTQQGTSSTNFRRQSLGSTNPDLRNASSPLSPSQIVDIVPPLPPPPPARPPGASITPIREELSSRLDVIGTTGFSPIPTPLPPDSGLVFYPPLNQKLLASARSIIKHNPYVPNKSAYVMDPSEILSSLS